MRGSLDSGTCITGLKHGPSSSTDVVHCLPSLICIGMAKAGTGELRGWLSTHPGVVVSTIGEPQYFNHGLPRAWVRMQNYSNLTHLGGREMRRPLEYEANMTRLRSALAATWLSSRRRRASTASTAPLKALHCCTVQCTLLCAT